MKTLIIYASKHGSAGKCSSILRERLQGEVVIVDIKKGNVPDVKSFDKVIIGASIHVGRIQKEISEFCQKNINQLKEKKLGLYICCMNKNEEDKQLNSAFPQELLNSAIAKECFGGEFNFGKMNMMERLAVKMVSKSQGEPITDFKKDISRISQDNINRFVQLMNMN
jgi:menaquinone-dependent protoporphyrinogen oxidase